MRKELIFEFKTYPSAKKAYKCLCDRLEIQNLEEETGGTMLARTEDRSLQVRLITASNKRGGLSVEVHVRLSDEKFMGDVQACLGEPSRDRTVDPSAQSFAEAVLSLEFTGDVDAFVDSVSKQLGIRQDRFGTYRAMVLTTAGMPSASELIKDAAEKLKKL